jgi:hypothetical protein
MEALRRTAKMTRIGLGVGSRCWRDRQGSLFGVPGAHQAAKTLRYMKRAHEGQGAMNPNVWNAVVGGRHVKLRLPVCIAMRLHLPASNATALKRNNLHATLRIRELSKSSTSAEILAVSSSSWKDSRGLVADGRVLLRDQSKYW